MINDNPLCRITTEIAVKRQNTNHLKHIILMIYTRKNTNVFHMLN
jgi:hypothetical protein